MIENLDHIIQQYWAGESSLEEEQQLKVYLSSDDVKPEHLEMVPLFSFFKDQHNIVSKAIDLSFLAGEVGADMNTIIAKYWAGETSLEEEKTLQTYLTSGQVASEHLDMVPLFSYFEEQEDIVMTKELDMSFLNEAVTQKVTNAAQAKKTKVRRLFPRVAAIAASLALLLIVTFTFMDDSALGSKHLAEVEDADEALELTMEALAFLGHKYDKGANPMKHLKQLEKTNVFSFN